MLKVFFLLNAANMTSDAEKLARTTITELKYNKMKDKIMKILGDPIAITGTDGGIEAAAEVKDEVLYTSERDRYKGKSRGRGYRGKSNRGYYPRNTTGQQNAVGSDGNIMRCHIC